MKITLEPTPMVVTIDGVPTRVWQGHTEKGVPIHAHVALVAVDRAEDSSELESMLREVAQPRVDLERYPLAISLRKVI